LSRTATDDNTPPQDFVDRAHFENSPTQTSGSQEESQEDIKESQEEVEVTKTVRKNVRQTAKKDPSYTQTTGKVSRIYVSTFHLIFAL